jgi:multiple sugar transport system substrate-binding protein
MKRKLCAIAMVVTAVVLVVGLAGCGNKSGGKAALTMWCAYSQPDRIEAMDKAIAAFQQENPGITVTRELVPWGEINQKWASAKMAKTLPQLVVNSDSGLIGLWAAGDLEPVDDVVQAMGGPGAFLEGPLEGLHMDGHYIALPHYTLSWKLMVRKDWLAELGLPVPKTWDEFAAAAIAMTKPPERYGFDIPFGKSANKSREYLMYFMRTNGADFLDASGHAHFDTPETIETVKFLADLAKKAGRQAQLNYSEDDCYQNFAKGSLGFVYAAGSFVDVVRKLDPALFDKMELIETPRKTTDPVDGAGLVGIGKFKGVKYSQETSKFLQFLLRQDIYRDFLFSMASQIPITVEGSKDNLFWDDPRIKEYAHFFQRWTEGAMTGRRVGMEHGPNPQTSFAMPGSPIEEMFQNILVDNVPVEAAVKTVNDKIVENLKAAGFN